MYTDKEIILNSLTDKETEKLKKSYNKYVKSQEPADVVTFDEYVNHLLDVTALEHAVLTKCNYKQIIDNEINRMDKELLLYRNNGFTPHNVFKKHFKRFNVSYHYGLNEIKKVAE